MRFVRVLALQATGAMLALAAAATPHVPATPHASATPHAAATTAAPATAAGITVALMPSIRAVAPGDTFSVDLQVTRRGSSFNAFDALIGYDPAMLVRLPAAPSSPEEGPYFAEACANRYHVFRQGAGVDSISDVLLCAGTSLHGPGSIYRFHFQAGNIPGQTLVRVLPGLQFFDAGLYMNPDSSRDAIVAIGVAAPSSPPPVTAPSLELAVERSTADSIVFRIATDRDGDQRLLIMDARQRIVRRLEFGRFRAGERKLFWDGRDDGGTVVAPGEYEVRLQVPGRTAAAPFAWRP